MFKNRYLDDNVVNKIFNLIIHPLFTIFSYLLSFSFATDKFTDMIIGYRNACVVITITML